MGQEFLERYLPADVVYALCDLYQVVAQPIGKHDLLCLIRDAYGRDRAPDGVASEVSDRSMNGDKLRRDTGYVSVRWDPCPCRAEQHGHDRAADPDDGLLRVLTSFLGS